MKKSGAAADDARVAATHRRRALPRKIGPRAAAAETPLHERVRRTWAAPLVPGAGLGDGLRAVEHAPGAGARAGDVAEARGGDGRHVVAKSDADVPDARAHDHHAVRRGGGRPRVVRVVESRRARDARDVA